MNRDIAWVIFFLLLLGVAWAAQNKSSGTLGGGGIILEPGGSSSRPDSYSSFQSTDSSSSKPQEKIDTKEDLEETNKWEGAINISYARAKENNPQKEYIELRPSFSAKDSMPISGWYLQNRDGTKAQIPKGTNLAYSARVNPQQTIYLNSGDRAIIITGESPVGTSFRLNKCTGYFGQFQEFNPSLPKHCPDPEDELENSSLYYEDECYNYVKTLSRCETPLRDFALDISNDCREFLNEDLTYTSCVDAHKNDDDFYEKEWRIYLGRNEELWSNGRDAIRLFDDKGNLIKEIAY